MDDVREIVTKAVVGKGKKIIKINETITPGIDIISILGCFIINHNYNTKIVDRNHVDIAGNAEIDIWVTTKNNTQTEIIRQTFNYTDQIKTRSLVNQLCNDDLNVLVTVVNGPSCVNVEVDSDTLTIEVTLEIVIEVIGETKVQVIICEPVELLDDDFDNEINEDFIKEG